MPDRFALRGHAWVPKVEVAEGDEVLRRDRAMALVRLGPRATKAAKPSTEHSRFPTTPPPPDLLTGELPPLWWLPPKLVPGLMARSALPPPGPDVPPTANLRTVIDDLIESARTNDADLRALVDVARLCVRAVNAIARSDPQRVRPIAGKLMAWPVMTGTCPQIGDDADALLKGIRLGASLPILMDRSSRWKKDLATLCAVRLLDHILAIQTEPANRLHRRARKFPVLAKDTAEAWFFIAKKVLRRDYSDRLLGALPEFRQMVTSRTKLRTPGKIRASVLEVLRDRFRALARP